MMVQPAQANQAERRHHCLFWLMGGLAALLLSLLLFCLCLPLLVEWQVQRLLDDLSDESSWQFSVSRIGLFSSDFRLLVPDPDDPDGDPWLAVDSGQLFYRPLALLRGHIAAVRLSGVQGELRWQEERWLVPVSGSLRRQPAAEITAVPMIGLRPWLDWVRALPVSISELSLSGVLRLHLENELSVLPFRVQVLNLEARAEDDIQLTARTLLGGNSVRVQAKLRPEDGLFAVEADFSLQADSLPPCWRSQLPPLTSMQGRVSAKGQWNDMALLPEQLELEMPLQISAGSTDWQLTGQPRLSLRRADDSLRLQLQDLNWTWRQQQALRIARAEVEADLAGGQLRGGLLLAWDSQPAQDFVLDGSWQGAATGTGRLLALFSGASSGELQLQAGAANGAAGLKLDGNEFSCKKPELVLNWGQGAAAGLGVGLRIDEVVLSRGQDRLTGRQLAARAQLSGAGFSLQGTLSALTLVHGDLKVESSDIVITASGLADGLRVQFSGASLLAGAGQDSLLQFPGFELNLESSSGAVSLRYSGRLVLKDGRLQERKTDITVEEISADLPFFWPLDSPHAGETGLLHIGRISRRNTPLGHLRLGCAWETDGLRVQGEAVLLGLQASLTGGLFVDPGGALRAESALQLPGQSLPGDLPWREWLPEWSDLGLAGQVEADLHFNWDSGRPDGRIRLRISNLDAVSVSRGLALRGGQLTLEFPRLPEVTTAGSQRLSCRELKLGRLQFGRGMVQFRIDSPRLAYLESLRLDWCEGTLRTGSVRLSPDSDRLLLTLYGDRLRLPAMLAQFGFGSAEGEGRISGSLPMLLSRDDIRFRDGFLYSTPGETGQIKLQPSALVSSAAGASDQMQLALEALKDFSYNWVRLALDTDAESLQLSLQLDGKPNQRLYFRPQGGGFVKSEVANDFQGLALNLNISVPLQELLRHYGNWQKLTR